LPKVQRKPSQEIIALVKITTRKIKKISLSKDIVWVFSVINQLSQQVNNKPEWIF
jgi:hypothetical protein